MTFCGDLKKDMAALRERLKDDDTIVFRTFENKTSMQLRGCVVYTEVLVSTPVIDHYIVAPLINTDMKALRPKPYLVDTVMEKVLEANEVKAHSTLEDAISALLIGDTLILLDGAPCVIAANSKSYPARGVGVPETETTVAGPKEAFTEVLVFNMGLLRRKMKNPKLKLKTMEVGKITKTRICLSYVEGLVEPILLEELTARLQHFEIDAALDSNYLAELCRDDRASPFKTVGTTERPDVVAGKLLEGRVAILCDGSPFALTVPFLFLENFQSNEDYYNHFYFATFTRIMRYFSFFLTISLPGLYVALIAYHKEMIPLNLLLSIVNSRDAVPFPAVVEMVILLVLFDLLREAGLRLPAPIGGTIGTVGGIVLGQSIVTARLVSAEMIIIVAVCAITSFLTPKLDIELILCRMLILFFAATLGIYGYAIGIIAILVHLASLRSFGVEYLSYLSATSAQTAKDVYVRAPWWMMRRRPAAIQRRNLTRLRHKGAKR